MSSDSSFLRRRESSSTARSAGKSIMRAFACGDVSGGLAYRRRAVRGSAPYPPRGERFLGAALRNRGGRRPLGGRRRPVRGKRGGFFAQPTRSAGASHAMRNPCLTFSTPWEFLEAP
jgi:hypothetical protein